MKMSHRRLVTAALPYVNNEPHLGTLVQVLSADVYARYCRLRGCQTLYVCGTDEYGTATETRALIEGITPRQLCDHYHSIHLDVYRWFNIDFDIFGRTSSPVHSNITRLVFEQLDQAGRIIERATEQFFCPNDRRFLADRFIVGHCPRCEYDSAGGDQCEACGHVHDPTDLKNPRCAICGSTPTLLSSKHLFVDLAGLQDRLERWFTSPHVAKTWTKNATTVTRSWLAEGLRQRSITRDLSWGVSVPRSGYESKVFYVWFDAPIGYISITATLTPDWRTWWMSKDVELVQFVGKDNIPFHAVLFPAILLGTKEPWTLVHRLSATDYLNYEGGKFSKSRGVGVFGSDAQESGIPADVWRYYIMAIRPERGDSLFQWDDFRERVNSDLVGNFGNLVNRVCSFISRYYAGTLPDAHGSQDFRDDRRRLVHDISQCFEETRFREALSKIMTLSRVANKRFQEFEPWHLISRDRPAVSDLMVDLIYLIRDIAVMLSPFVPAATHTIRRSLGIDLESFSWNHIGNYSGITTIVVPPKLFSPLDKSFMEELRARCSGQ